LKTKQAKKNSLLCFFAARLSFVDFQSGALQEIKLAAAKFFSITFYRFFCLFLSLFQA
jgi:hypothetical protein